MNTTEFTTEPRIGVAIRTSNTKTVGPTSIITAATGNWMTENKTEATTGTTEATCTAATQSGRPAWAGST